MKQIIRALAVPILAFAVLPNPAGAETPPPIQMVAPDPYDDLYVAINEGADKDAILDSMLLAIINEIRRQVPEMAILEDIDPAFATNFQQAIKPVLTRHSERVQSEYQPRMVEILSEELTPEEAISVAAFYRSDLGRKVVMTASQSFSSDEIVRQIGKDLGQDQDIEASVVAISADLKKTSIDSYLALSTTERAELTQVTLNTPGLIKLQSVMPRLHAVRAEMENVPLTPEDEASMQSAMEAVFNAALAGLE